MPSFINQFSDFNMDVFEDDDPKLDGYVSVSFFRTADSDKSSRRIRDVTVPIDFFFDYNLEKPCGTFDNDWN